MTPDTALVGDVGGWMFLVIAVIGALAVIGVAVNALDRKRERADRALALQARIADALRQEPAIRHAPVRAAAHVPLRRDAPVVIELQGEVPTSALRKAVISLVVREAFRSGMRFRIEEQIAVVQSLPRAA